MYNCEGSDSDNVCCMSINENSDSNLEVTQNNTPSNTNPENVNAYSQVTLLSTALIIPSIHCTHCWLRFKGVLP